MSVEYWPGGNESNPNDVALFDWLEAEIVDKDFLRALEKNLIDTNPALYRVIADTAAEIAPGDPKAHATYFGSLLMRATEEMHIQIVSPETPPMAA